MRTDDFSEIASDFSKAARAVRDATIGALLAGGGALSGWPLRHRLFAATPSWVGSGQTVLITGSSSGIGRALALKSADAGATVLLVARSETKLRELEREIVLSGGRACVYVADLAAAESTEALLGRIAADGIAIDVLVNNAGRSIRRAIGESYERVHDYERTMALNYFGPVRLMLGLLPKMRTRGMGHVVNVSSAGVQMGTPLFSAYIASKAALDAFTRVAASEASGDGVRFTTLHMPLVRTPMIEPTKEFRNIPALRPDEAADLVLRALVTRESHIGTRVAALFDLGHVVAPEAVERMVSFGQRLVSGSAAARDLRRAADPFSTADRDARSRSADRRPISPGA